MFLLYGEKGLYRDSSKYLRRKGIKERSLWILGIFDNARNFLNGQPVLFGNLNWGMPQSNFFSNPSIAIPDAALLGAFLVYPAICSSAGKWSQPADLKR